MTYQLDTYREYGTTAHTVTARTRHLCAERLRGDEPGQLRCSGIEPGDDYARLVAFPSADFMSGDRPWVMRICEPCHLWRNAKMPPRKTAKRREVAR